MRLLISAFTKSKGPGKLLLVDEDQIIDSLDHDTNYRGIAKTDYLYDNQYFVVDKKGQVFEITMDNDSLKRELVGSFDDIHDGHDLAIYNDKLLVSCTAKTHAKTMDGETYRPFLTDRKTLDNLDTNNQDLYHMNCVHPYFNGFLISVFSTVPYMNRGGRWRDRKTDGAILYWTQKGFERIIEHGLSQPYSIRTKGDHIYFCDSKKSQFCHVSFPTSNSCKTDIKPKGFLRGMDIIQHNKKVKSWIIGHSKSRVMDAGQTGYTKLTIDGDQKFVGIDGNFTEIYDLKVVD